MRNALFYTRPLSIVLVAILICAVVSLSNVGVVSAAESTGSPARHVPNRITALESAPASEISVLTFNKKNDNSNSNINALISQVNPDVFGLQEVSVLLQSAPAFSGYSLASGTDKKRGGSLLKGENPYEALPVYYRASKFMLRTSGIKWLSDTPDKESRFSDSAYHRVMTFAVLEEKSTGAQFIFANLQFDNKYDGTTDTNFVKARQAKVAASEILKIEQVWPNAAGQTIMVGDYNAGPGQTMNYIKGMGTPPGGLMSFPLGARLADAYDAAPLSARTPNRWGGWWTMNNANPDLIADHILVAHAAFDMRLFQIAQDAYGSDHLPVSAILSFATDTDEDDSGSGGSDNNGGGDGDGGSGSDDGGDGSGDGGSDDGGDGSGSGGSDNNGADDGSSDNNGDGDGSDDDDSDGGSDNNDDGDGSDDDDSDGGSDNNDDGDGSDDDDSDGGSDNNDDSDGSDDDDSDGGDNSGADDGDSDDNSTNKNPSDVSSGNNQIDKTKVSADKSQTKAKKSAPTKLRKLRIVSIQLKNGKIKIKWSKPKAKEKVTCYQIKYKKTGAKKWKIKNARTKKTTVTFRMLKKGCTYRFKIRSIKKVAGITYHSAWSKSKSLRLPLR
ncbi:MAG: fibronectin type III domain-containing protein [Clostridiales Family XIII bacterium]|jgi:endonuclease/exonuclease/phosphatase family metal-dependent hydrolase|nr:fibronectin type III domain-containing protein [Clostridiales Family XIII bacterium]